MVKIIHAADLHLDSAFAALNNEQARERRAHQRELVQKIVDIGNEEQVDLILFSGDMFDGKNAYYETAEAMSRAFAKSNARIFIAPGNHDPYNQKSPYRSVQFSDNVHLFTGEIIERIAIPELGCVIYGAGFTGSACPSSLLDGFVASDDAIKIMVMHGEVTNSDSNYNPISIDQISNSNLDYLALGHVHTSGGICKAGNTHYAYPGTPEGRGFDETGEKGILIGTISADEVTLKMRKISPYTYTERIIDINKNDLENYFSDSYECEVCRLILQGTSEGVDVKDLTEKVGSRFYKLTVVDRTEAPYDVWAAAEEDSVKGLFLRKLRNLDADSEIIERAAKYGLAAIENREGVR